MRKEVLYSGCRQIIPKLLLAVLLLFAHHVSAQSVATYGGASVTINTYENALSGGSTTNAFYVQYQSFPSNFNLPAGWTLKVKANGDFINGAASVPAGFVSLSFNGADGGPSGVSGTGSQALSKTTPAALITTSAPLQSPPFHYFVHRLNMSVAGGVHLLAGTGTFSTTLSLTLVRADGTVAATSGAIPISIVINFDNTCTGATISSYMSNEASFTSYASQMAGKTVTDAITVQYNPNATTCLGWSLKVRAQGDFVNGSNSVPPQHFSLRFNRVSVGVPTAAQIGINTNPIPISYTDVALIDQSDKGFTAWTATEHKFDLVIAGGNHLLVPNGTYRGNLVFTLYNQGGQVVSTRVQEVSFQINSIVNSYTVVFQNSSDVIDLTFNTPAHYTNGVSVTKAQGLKITGYTPYQVLIKTNSENFAGPVGSTIPVAAVSIEATKHTPTNGTVSTYTRALSTTDQILISNPLTDYTHQVVEYNLRYFTSPADTRLIGNSGTFNTTVIFVTMPQ